MKYNMKSIMNRAWEIKREDRRNLFSLCLKMAWAEAKTPAYLTGDALYNRLYDMGASRWTRGSYDRLYLNEAAEKLAGLEVHYYKSGNVSAAWLNGEEISNAFAREILCRLGSMYIDLTTGDIMGRRSTTRANEIASAVCHAIRHIAA